ncbi:unnamed protein product [Mycena citricolor]|uniref:glutathione transferase n=1 Tax=Mycena citricolor TaxID=2018698 RepID=A0AAD2HES6_9AGAR|nr:unnamed protein product [Mycena citricolor]
MVLKLYGSPRAAGATHAVLVTLLEKQVPFENCALDLPNRAHLAPAHTARQPFKQFPVIEDDGGFVLYESRAICRYLEEKYAGQGTSLGPPVPGAGADALRARAVFEQAVSVETSNFHPHAHRIYAERISKRRRGLKPDECAVEEALQQLSATLDVYEEILGRTRYLAGDAFTLADLFHLSFGGVLSLAGCDIMTSETRPNVTRWWQDIQSRPSVRRFPEATAFTSVDSY